MKHFAFITVLLLFFFQCRAVFSQSPEFPPDPAGRKVIDRDCLRMNPGNKLLAFYAVMYNTEKVTVIDIYRGADGTKHVEWKKLLSWKLMFQGSPILLREPSLVRIISRDDEEVIFYFIDDLKYREAKVHLEKVYHISTGAFSENWSD
ncbi:MAG: hypothetical protein RDV48_18960 [Candidatus Eremiobacteraeota bacterium]|nr:hypothetical protein [Candidatus Eremiobacteraeota bacterium]